MKWIVIVAAALVATTAHSETSIETCAIIDADQDRLSCYDKVSGRTPVKVPVAETNLTGNWYTQINKSKFEDTTDVTLSILSKGVVSCTRYGSSDYVSLVLRCHENTTALYLKTQDCFLASGVSGYGQVDARLDGDKSSTLHMVESTDNRSLGLWRGSNSIPYIKKMFDKETLLVRFTPYNESPVTAEFNIAGVEEAVKPLRNACSW